MGPSSRPTLAPMWSSPHPTVSQSSSSVTLTDSDSELSDEARDSFDPSELVFHCCLLLTFLSDGS